MNGDVIYIPRPKRVLGLKKKNRGSIYVVNFTVL